MVECIVEYDYEAEQPDELTIKVGQVIKNVVTEDGGWWEGELDGKKGMFPDNFVKIIDKQKEKPVEKREDLKKDAIKTQQRTSVRDLASKMKDGIPVGASQKKKDAHQPVIKRAKVLFSYEPDNEDELKLDVDDIVDVFKQEEEGWWEGSLNGKVGVFPSNFVEVIEELETASKPAVEEKPKEPPQAEPKTKKIVGGVGLGNIFDGGPIKLRATGAKKQPPEPENKPEEPPSHPAPAAPKKDKQERAVVRHSYEADNEDELSLKVGDVVNIISKEEEDPGWWKGELNGKVGVFPDNFVEIMHDEFGTDKRPPSKFLPKTEPQERNMAKKPRPKKPPPPASAPAAQATVKLPEKPAPLDPALTEKNVKKKDELPSVDKSAQPALPSKKPTVPPPLLRKPAKPDPPRPTSYAEHKISAPAIKEDTVSDEKKSSGNFDDIQTSTEKLQHLTAMRPKGPSKRPPSQVFNHMEEERNGDVKDSHWIKDDKAVHHGKPAKDEKLPHHPPKSHVKDIKEEQVGRVSSPSLPARPPEPSTTANTGFPPAAITSLHTAIEDLKKEVQHLKSTTVSKVAFDELKQENEKLRHEMDSLKASCNRKLRDLVNEVDEEKKIRLSTQVEIERIKKLVNESHV